MDNNNFNNYFPNFSYPQPNYPQQQNPYPFYNQQLQQTFSPTNTGFSGNNFFTVNFNVTVNSPPESPPRIEKGVSKIVSIENIFEDIDKEHPKEIEIAKKALQINPKYKKRRGSTDQYKISKKTGLVSKTVIETKKFIYVKSNEKALSRDKSFRRITSYDKKTLLEKETAKSANFLYIGTKISSSSNVKKVQMERVQNEIHFFDTFKADDVFPLVAKKAVTNSKYSIFVQKFGVCLYDLLFDSEIDLTDRQKMSIAKQLVNLVKTVHLQGFTLGDLKLENIVVERLPNQEFKVKLIDFDFSKDHTSGLIKKNDRCGTIELFSPEMIFEKKVDYFKADMWALGLTLFDLFNKTGKLPFHETHATVRKLHEKGQWWNESQKEQFIKDFHSGTLIPLFEREKLDENSDEYFLYSKLEELIHGLLEFEPTERLDILETHKSLDDLSKQLYN